jgi:hypothetical protein
MKLYTEEDFNFDVVHEGHICDPTPSELANKANDIHEERCIYKKGYENLDTELIKYLLQVDKEYILEQENIKLKKQLEIAKHQLECAVKPDVYCVDTIEHEYFKNENTKLNAMLIEQNIQVVKMTEKIEKLEKENNELDNSRQDSMSRVKELECEVSDLEYQLDRAWNANGFIG